MGDLHQSVCENWGRFNAYSDLYQSVCVNWGRFHAYSGWVIYTKECVIIVDVSMLIVGG